MANEEHLKILMQGGEVGIGGGRRILIYNRI